MSGTFNNADNRFLIGLRNATTQTVLADGIINIGSVYRRFEDRNIFRGNTFTTNGNSVTINQRGIYKVTATFVGTGDAAGDLTVQLLENGEPINGALATETVVTPDTEFHTLVIDHLVLVDRSNIWGFSSSSPKTISFQITGDIGATFTSVTVNVVKEA